MNTTFSCIMWLLLTATSISVSGQTLELPKNIQSPNASSLGKYGDIPMNLSTGRANINVPIYSLNDAHIPFDISLSYDTGGVAVNDHPGWVGQNWSLNAGGIITRTMKGKNFDEYQGESHTGYIKQGYMFKHSILNVFNWNSDDYLRNIADHAGTNENPDLEPDIFTFNFMGFSGKFFLGEDGEWKVASDGNFKVEIDLNDNVKPLGLEHVGYSMANLGLPPVKTIGKIKLISAEGNQYIFGGNMNSIEFNVIDFFSQSNKFMFASAWYLTKVLDPYNNEIYSLEYERGGYQAAFYNNYSIDNYQLSGGGALSPSCTSMTYLNEAVASGSLIVPSYLKKIKAPQSDLVFDFSSSESKSLHYSSSEPTLQNAFKQNLWPTYDYQTKILSRLFYLFYEMDGVTINYPDEGFGNMFNLGTVLKRLKWRKLDTISIHGKVLSKQVQFTYDDTPSTRLKLESIKPDADQSYQFSYIRFNDLPDFLSTKVDHFGYYNGKDFSLNPNLHYRSRNSDVSTVQYGSLNRIIYPTKGSTLFEYEPHRYSQSLNKNNVVISEKGNIGGLRIKRKTDYDIYFSPVKSTDYQYTSAINSTLSSGILVKKNLYSFPNWSMKTNEGSLYVGSTFSINSVIPLSNFSGSFIEYSTVIEKENGKGYTANEFTNYLDYPNKRGATIAEAHSIMDPKTERGFQRGKLKLASYYSENNTLLKEEKYDYANNAMQKVRAFNFNNESVCSGSLGISTGTAYEIYYADFSLKEKITKVYNGSQVTETKEYFNYDTKGNFGDNFLKEKQIIYPDTQKEEENYTYTFDKTSPVYTELANKRNYSIISKEMKLNAVPTIKSEIDYTKVPIYDSIGNVTSRKDIFPTAYSQSFNGSASQNELVIDQYDQYGNIMMAHSNGMYYSYYYAYNGKYPVLKMEGKTVAQQNSLANTIKNLIHLCETNSSINDQIINVQKEIRVLLPDHQVTAYTYFPNVGVESISSPDGIIEYYVYDDHYRLKFIKDSDKKILKEFKNNYSTVNPVGDIFYNYERKINITKNDCPNGQEGGDYEFIIPFGKFISLVSQQDADNKASQDIVNNGQAEANFNESCDVQNCMNFSSFFNGVTIQKIGYRKVKVDIDLYFNYLSYNWNEGVTIGQINLDCAPAYKTFWYDIGTANPNAIWTVNVDVYGKVILKYDGDLSQIPHYQMSFIFYAE